MSLTELITAIATVVVVLLMIFIFTGLYRETFLSSLFGGGMSSEEQELYENNFDRLKTNILACKDIEDNKCLCQGFPDFPGTFKGTLYFTVKSKNMLMELKANKKSISSEELENVFITGVLIEKTGLGDFNEFAQKYDSYFEKWIDFTKNPPKFDNKGLGKTLFWGISEPNVVDSRMYKDEQGFIRILLSYENSPEIAIRISELRECGKEQD